MKRAITLFFVMTACATIFGEKKSIQATLQQPGITGIRTNITVTSPKGGEVWKAGTSHDITWTFRGYPAGTKVKLALTHNGMPVGVLVGGSQMASAVNVDIGSDGKGTYHFWWVPAYGFAPNISSAPCGTGYKVRIYIVNSQSTYYQSQGAFTITCIQP